MEQQGWSHAAGTGEVWWEVGSEEKGERESRDSLKNGIVDGTEREELGREMEGNKWEEGIERRTLMEEEM